MSSVPSPALTTAAAAFCAVLAAGCGGQKEPPARAAVREALQRFDRVQAAGDGRAACNGLVAVEEQGRIEVPGAEERKREAAGRNAGEAGHATEGKREADADAKGEAEADKQGAGAADRGAAACERAFAQAAANRKVLRDVELEVKAVTVKGDDATASIQTRLTRPDGSKLSQDGTRRLVRRDGRWRVVITEE